LLWGNHVIDARGEWARLVESEARSEEGSFE